MVKIITAAPHQLPIVRQIALVTWPHTFREILSEQQIAYMLNMMYSPTSLQQQTDAGTVFLLAEVEGAFGGFAGYELNYKHAPVCKLHKIYVLPSMQGKQVGKALLHEVARIGREAGMRRLSLNVNRSNNAVGFYERIGFTKTGEEDIDIGNGFFMNDAIMDMPL